MSQHCSNNTGGGFQNFTEFDMYTSNKVKGQCESACFGHFSKNAC